MNVDLRQLEHVVEICRSGSISAAARALRVSQSTLSRSVAHLEQKLGMTLFARSEIGARPSATAALIAQRGTEILALVEQLRADLRLHAIGDRDTIRVGVGPATRLRPLPDVLRLIDRHFPDLRVEVKQEAGTVVTQGLIDGRYDVVFTAADNAADKLDLVRNVLFVDEVVAAVRPHHPLAGRGPLTLADVASYPIASFRVSYLRQSLIDAAPDGSASRIDAHRSDDAETLRTRSLRSDYVTVVPAFVVAQELEAGTLVRLDVAGTGKFECWMLMTRQTAAVPLFRDLALHVRAAFARNRPIVRQAMEDTP